MFDVSSFPAMLSIIRRHLQRSVDTLIINQRFYFCWVQVYQVFDSSRKIKAIKEVNLDNANSVIVEGYKNEIALLRRLQYCDKVIKMYDR